MNAIKIPSLIAVDVGNSRTKFGLFAPADGTDASRPHAERSLPACRQTLAVARDDAIPWGQIESWTAERPLAAIVAGANPAGVRKVLDGWPASLGPPPNVVDDPRQLPIALEVDEPGKVGIDRVLNAVAANAVREADCAAIIVDCGTATTVDYVTAGGAFAGGAILPGFELAARALHEYTALLPLIPIYELSAGAVTEGGTTAVPEAVGRNTVAALRSGLFWGQLGAVKELCGQLENLTRRGRNVGWTPSSVPSSSATDEGVHPPKCAHTLLLTGGGAFLLAPHFPQARFEPYLALQGLVLSQPLERDSSVV